jgi:hypothetical protein
MSLSSRPILHPATVTPPGEHRDRDRSSLTPLIIFSLLAILFVGGGLLLLRRASRQALDAETALLDSDNERQAMLLAAHRKVAAETAARAAQVTAPEAAPLGAHTPTTGIPAAERAAMPLRLKPGRVPIELSRSSEPVTNEVAAPPPPDPSTLKLDAMDRAGIHLPPEALDELERRGLLQY